MSRDALVVGINCYQDERLPNLTAPASDAEAIASLLEQYGNFKVWRLPEAIDKENNVSYVGKEIKVNLTELPKKNYGCKTHSLNSSCSHPEKLNRY